MKTKQYIFIFLITLLTACQFGDEPYVDFTDIDATKGLSFQVIGQHETDLTHGYPEQCYLPDGTPVNTYRGEENSTNLPDGMHRTNSTSGSAILQQIYKYGQQNKVIEIVGTYPSVDLNGDTGAVSGAAGSENK